MTVSTMSDKAKTLRKLFTDKHIIGNVVYPVIGIGVVLLFWYLLSVIVGIEMILPSPTRAFEEFFALFSESDFWTAVSGTMLRTLTAFGIAFALAAVTSALSVFVEPVGRILSPIITILRSIPTMSIILIAIIAFKPTESPILVTFLISYPLLHASFSHAITNVDPFIVNMSKVFKVPVYKRIFKMYIPAMLPEVLTAVGSNISLALKVMIASEVLAQTFESMGVAMQIQRIYLNTAGLMGWTIAAIVLSFLLEIAVKLIALVFVRRK